MALKRKNPDIRDHPLKIKKVETKDPDYQSETPDHLRNQFFPGFPSTSVFVGPPGSGKTNVLMHMLLSTTMWNGFFDKVYLFGPTVKSDKMYERIQVDEQQICTDQKEFLPKLEEVLKKQQRQVEDDKKSAPKILVVFEDITSFFNKIQQKPEFVRCYTQVRHLKGASVAMVHKWKAFNRTARMATQHILVWRCNKTEQKQLYEDFGPTSLTLDDWFKLVAYCHRPSPDDEKPFLYINTTVPEKIRFRKNFTEILELKEFEVPHNPEWPKDKQKPVPDERESTKDQSAQTPGLPQLYQMLNQEKNAIAGTASSKIPT
jgi:hypothetical protein